MPSGPTLRDVFPQKFAKTTCNLPKALWQEEKCAWCHRHNATKPITVAILGFGWSHVDRGFIWIERGGGGYSPRNEDSLQNGTPAIQPGFTNLGFPLPSSTSPGLHHQTPGSSWSLKSKAPAQGRSWRTPATIPAPDKLNKDIWKSWFVPGFCVKPGASSKPTEDYN